MIPQLRINRLRLTNFRSYSSLDLETDAPVQVLVGPNGAGKTNILEALSLLTPGRGMRRATLAELSRRTPQTEPTEWAIHAQTDGLLGPVSLGTGIQNGKRVVRIDGETASGPGALAQHLSALWLTPTMDRLFIEGSAGRRRFLDRLVFGLSPAHGPLSTTYEKALRDRSQLLKDRSTDTQWLDTLEATMAQTGTQVAQGRLTTIQQLQDTIDATPDSLFPKATMTLKGYMEEALANGMTPEVAQADFVSELKSSRGRDAETGGAALGPHKSDLLVHHAEHGQAADQCSTGEQKALLVTLVLANASTQMQARQAAPLLLLDEVAAHIDADRRAALFHQVTTLGGQVWLTGTDRAFFHALEGIAQFHSVSESAIVP